MVETTARVWLDKYNYDQNIKMILNPNELITPKNKAVLSNGVVTPKKGTSIVEPSSTKKGAGVSTPLNMSSEEFLHKVSSALDDESQKKKLFETVRNYHESLKIKTLVRDLKLILDSDKKYPLFKDIRALIREEHQETYDKLTDKNVNGERMIRLKRDEDESLGFAYRGGKEHGLGFYVTSVKSGSIAETAGLKPGDELRRVNNLPLHETTHDELLTMLKNKTSLMLLVKYIAVVPTKQNKELVWKEVEEKSTNNAKLSEPKEPELERFVALRIGVEGLGCSIRTGISEYEGVFITNVASGSLAERVGLKIGDQVMNVNGRDFQSISHAEALQFFQSTQELSMVLHHNKVVEDLLNKRRNNRKDGGSVEKIAKSDNDKSARKSFVEKSELYAKVEGSRRQRGTTTGSKSRKTDKGDNDNKSILRNTSERKEVSKKASFSKKVDVEVIEVEKFEKEVENEEEVVVPASSNYDYSEKFLDGRKVHYVPIPKGAPLSMQLEKQDIKVVVKSVGKDGAVGKHGFLRRGDWLLNVEGDDLIGKSLKEANRMIFKSLRRWSKYIEFIVACPPGRLSPKLPNKRDTSELVRDAGQLYATSKTACSSEDDDISTLEISSYSDLPPDDVRKSTVLSSDDSDNKYTKYKKTPTHAQGSRESKPYAKYNNGGKVLVKRTSFSGSPVASGKHNLFYKEPAKTSGEEISNKPRVAQDATDEDDTRSEEVLRGVGAIVEKYSLAEKANEEVKEDEKRKLSQTPFKNSFNSNEGSPMYAKPQPSAKRKQGVTQEMSTSKSSLVHITLNGHQYGRESSEKPLPTPARSSQENATEVKFYKPDEKKVMEPRKTSFEQVNRKTITGHSKDVDPTKLKLSDLLPKEEEEGSFERQLVEPRETFNDVVNRFGGSTPRHEKKIAVVTTSAPLAVGTSVIQVGETKASNLMPTFFRESQKTFSSLPSTPLHEQPVKSATHETIYIATTTVSTTAASYITTPQVSFERREKNETVPQTIVKSHESAVISTGHSTPYRNKTFTSTPKLGVTSSLNSPYVGSPVQFQRKVTPKETVIVKEPNKINWVQPLGNELENVNDSANKENQSVKIRSIAFGGGAKKIPSVYMEKEARSDETNSTYSTSRVVENKTSFSVKEINDSFRKEDLKMFLVDGNGSKSKEATADLKATTPKPSEMSNFRKDDVINVHGLSRSESLKFKMKLEEITQREFERKTRESPEFPRKERHFNDVPFRGGSFSGSLTSINSLEEPRKRTPVKRSSSESSLTKTKVEELKKSFQIAVEESNKVKTSWEYIPREATRFYSPDAQAIDGDSLKSVDVMSPFPPSSPWNGPRGINDIPINKDATFLTRASSVSAPVSIDHPMPPVRSYSVGNFKQSSILSTSKDLKSIMQKGKKSSPKKVQFSQFVSVGVTSHSGASSPALTRSKLHSVENSPALPVTRFRRIQQNLSLQHSRVQSAEDSPGLPISRLYTAEDSPGLPTSRLYIDENSPARPTARFNSSPPEQNKRIFGESLAQNNQEDGKLLFDKPISTHPFHDPSNNDHVPTYGSGFFHKAKSRFSFSKSAKDTEVSLISATPVFDFDHVERENRIRRRQNGEPTNM